MSRVERQALVDRADPQLSIVRQCQLLKVACSMLYYQPASRAIEWRQQILLVEPTHHRQVIVAHLLS
jgi:hypothetical protein